MTKIILASRSPARKKLMKELGLAFECHASEIFEDMEARKEPKELAMFLAAEKAKAIAPKYSNAIIIGVDTFVLLHDEKIGKPQTIKNAKKILQKMSGKIVEVISGVAVVKTAAGARTKKAESQEKAQKMLTAYASTKLKMKKFTVAEINYFSNRRKNLSAAGCITIEDEGGKLVEEIDGDFNNVMGLPLFQLQKMLKKLGIKFS